MADLLSTCRLCLKPNPDPHADLFQDNTAPGVNYADQIGEFLSVQVEEKNNWPSIACMDCIAFLGQINNFREQIMSSHWTLHAQIHRVKDDDETTIVIVEGVEEEIIDEVTEHVYSDDIEVEEDMNYCEEEPEPEQILINTEDDPEGDSLLLEEKVPLVEEEKEYLVSEEALEEVMRSMELFKCNICKDEMDNLVHFMRHVRKNHEIKSYSFCCNIKPRNKGLIYDHIRLHLDENAFKCQECGRTFKCQKNLKIHMLQLHPSADEKPRYICDICGKSFAFAATCKAHQAVHTPGHFKCGFCEKVYTRPTTLQLHISMEHKRVNKVFCEICGKGFPTKSTLNSHKYYHGGPHGQAKPKPKRGKKNRRPKTDSF